MAPLRLDRRSLPPLPVLALLSLLAACTAAPPAPETVHLVPPGPLPPPAVYLEQMPAADLLAEPVEHSPDLPAPFSEAPEDLARELYGERLVEWIRIDAIEVFAPVTPVGWSTDGSPDNLEAVEWDSPGAKVGWVIDSALPGDAQGNIILYGHNNINSSVFRDLADLQAGDAIALSTSQGDWAYEVAEVHIVPVDESQGDRAEYARHLLPGLAPRLTLISCWPPDNNTHRVIVVAYPEIFSGKWVVPKRDAYAMGSGQ